MNGTKIKMKMGYQKSSSLSKLYTNSLSKIESSLITTLRNVAMFCSSHSISSILTLHLTVDKLGAADSGYNAFRAAPLFRLFARRVNMSVINPRKPVGF
jgi:hypothetical protein